jgi:MFS transporter, FHS family, L-fucose permease
LGGSGYSDILILGVSEVNFSFILPLVCFLLIAMYGWNVFYTHGKAKS